jgi:LDH2 family malate/lactate/ureidoglycolate dehydrogenase
MMIAFDAIELRQVAGRIFRAAGVESRPTEIVVDHLIDANLAGHDSHGIQLIPRYIQEIREGKIQPNSWPSVVRETPVAALVDAKWSFGQVSARYGAEVAVAKAKERGVAVVGIIRGNHIGRLGTYPTLAARQGVVLMVTTGDLAPGVVPFGGARPIFDTNPFAFGFPASGYPDILVDFATSVIAFGKIGVARAKHQQIPAGCLLDRDGKPTTDPEAAFAGGMLLPMGGHKGYGLAVLSVLLSQVLVPAKETGAGVVETGTFMVAIDVGLFRDPSAVRAETDRVVAQIKAVPPAPGVAEVLVAGEPEVRAAELRRSDGIPIPEDTWAELVATAQSLGLTLDRTAG